MPRGFNKQNIKKVIDALRENPRKWTDLKKITRIADKSLARILKDYLQYWGLVTNVEGQWSWYQHVKAYATENDRNLAIDHSQKLLSHLHESGRKFNELNVLRITDILVFDNSASLYIESIRKHLRTGYYPEIFEYMEQYKNLMDKSGLFRISAYPIITVSDFELSKLDEVIEISEIANLPIGYEPKDDDEGDGERIEAEKYIEKVVLIEILTLQNRIARRFISLLFSIENGNPLRGLCDHCPNTIEN